MASPERAIKPIKPRRWKLAASLLLALGWTASAPAGPPPPELLFTAPPELAGVAARLERYDRESLRTVMELVGCDQAGPPIRVVLAPEGSAAARRAPSWSAGYAVGAAGLVVLLPGRIPGYPDHTLETVLRHEVAHVLIARAARRRPVPRWLDEGLAMYAARPWNLEDRSRLLWATLRYGSRSPAELDRGFHAGPFQAARAYAFAGAFVRYLMKEYGAEVPARTLDGIAAGRSGEEAFRQAAGTSLGAAQESFLRHLDFWNRWLPFLTSSTTLWLAVTILALVAFRRRRLRDAEMRALWEEEERRQLTAEASDEWVN